MAERPEQPPHESTTRIDGNVDGDVLSGTFNAPVTINKISPVQPIVLTIQESRNRQAMIDKVRRFWITDYLKHSLIEEVQIALDLADRPGATLTPTNLVARLPGQAADRPLPPGTSIVSVYDDQAQALLILGAPGAGKTTLLLDLTETLLDRAEWDTTHPIPVVFNLSAWGPSRLAFDIWLVEQLNLVYDVPRKLAQTWVTQGLILPLLDGLDEVASDRRVACVEAINTYRQSKAGLHPIVICCREAEYQALPPLRLHGAIVVQPLTQRQIEDYLSTLGSSVSSLRVAVTGHPLLLEMLAIPLMLNIVTLVYRGEQPPSLDLAQNEAEWRDQIFAAYVAQALQRRKSGSFSEPRIRHCLAWLAWQMQQRRQSMFLIEKLQPDWFGSLHGKLTYRVISVLVIVLVGGLILGLVGGLVGGQIFGLVVGLVGGLVAGLFAGLRESIVPVDRMHWSWREAYKGISTNRVSVLAGGLILGLVFGLVFGLLVGLVFGLLVGLVVGLLNGFKTVHLETRFHPNQGIWNSLQTSLVGGLIFGLLLGLIPELTLGLVAGLLAGLLAGFLQYGGAVVLRHLTLRLLLWRSGVIPWNLAAFLDTCADRILLRKVGGGYVFIHRMLLEWFAAQYQPGQRRQGDR